MTTKCKAQDSSVCPYHGDYQNLRVAAYNAGVDYTMIITDFDVKPYPASTIEAAKQRFLKTRASFDANDKQYVKLISEMNAYDLIEGDLSPKMQDNVSVLNERKELADAIRIKVKNPIIFTNSEAAKSPVKARVQKAEAEYTAVQEEIDAYNAGNTQKVQQILEAVASKQPVFTSPELRVLGEKLGAADKERNDARKALIALNRSEQILDRNDPEFLKTLDRKGRNKY